MAKEPGSNAEREDPPRERIFPLSVIFFFIYPLDGCPIFC
jgi:hypothetical protein